MPAPALALPKTDANASFVSFQGNKEPERERRRETELPAGCRKSSAAWNQALARKQSAKPVQNGSPARRRRRAADAAERQERAGTSSSARAPLPARSPQRRPARRSSRAALGDASVCAYGHPRGCEQDEIPRAGLAAGWEEQANESDTASAARNC